MTAKGVTKVLSSRQRHPCHAAATASSAPGRVKCGEFWRTPQDINRFYPYRAGDLERIFYCAREGEAALTIVNAVCRVESPRYDHARRRSAYNSLCFLLSGPDQILC